VDNKFFNLYNKLIKDLSFKINTNTMTRNTEEINDLNRVAISK
jgi:hypothetical protein